MIVRNRVDSRSGSCILASVSKAHHPTELRNPRPTDPQHHIPDDLREFLFATLESCDQLEVLLLVSASPDKMHTCKEISVQIGLPSESCLAVLNFLRTRALLQAHSSSEQTVYSAVPSEAVERLRLVYDSHRLVIIRMMNAHAMERIRANAMTAFADALIFSKKKTKDG